MQIAGGMFGFESNFDLHKNESYQFMHEPELFFLSARCAIQFLINYLKPPQVWMPSYLCCSMIDAIPEKSKLKFFPIGDNFDVISLDWIDLLIPGSLVILIDYFGFPCNTEVIRNVHDRECFVLEDASQALLSTHVGLLSDYIVYSPRKTVGVPDGGILQFKKGHIPPVVEMMLPPEEWWLKAFEACILRREFDQFGGERKWFEIFRQVEENFPLGLYRMSELSRILLENTFDFNGIAQARRDNFRYLLNVLSDHALFKSLDKDTVPLGFPIYVEERDKVLQILYAQQIYPPVHWRICNYVPSSFDISHNISNHIMTIPCDQRLKEQDVVQIANAVQRVIR